MIFAATAPYESIRLLLSIAAAKEETSHKGKVGGERLQISMIDINRAYFNAIVDEGKPIYVELPPEDHEHGRKCGRLRRHLYGTRGAAAGWEDEYSSFMVQAGFTMGHCFRVPILPPRKGFAGGSIRRRLHCSWQLQ